MSSIVLGLAVLLSLVGYQVGMRRYRMHRLRRKWEEAGAAMQRHAPEEARRLLEQCVRLEPLWAQGRLRLADVLTQMGQLSEAEEQYKMVAALQPRIASGHFVLGLFYAMHQPERRDDALAAVKKALELQPEMKKLLVEHYAHFKALHDHPEFRDLVS